MKEKQPKKTQGELIDVSDDVIREEEFLEYILPPLKDHLSAIFKRENKTALAVRFINGQTFRIQVEEVKKV